MTDLLRIDFGTIKQASLPTVTFVWPLTDGHTPDDLTGFTITATMRNVDSRAVTAVSGTFAVVDGATRTCTWSMSAGDTGTAGAYEVTLRAADGVDVIYTLFGWLVIQENPAVTAVANPPLVGVAQGDALFLETAAAAAAAADEHDVAVVDGSGNLAFTSQPRGFLMQRTVIDAGETVTIPALHQMIVAENLQVDGDLVADGDLHVV